MTHTDGAEAEFTDEAEDLADRIELMVGEDRIAAACRGSASPLALRWLAEGLRLGPDDRVVDLGAGLGGPAAWLRDNVGCTVFAADPSPTATDGAVRLFSLPTVQSAAATTPIADDSCVATLLLGVLSVVDDRAAVLREARRVAPRIGVIEYCAAHGDVWLAGGSRFPSAKLLTAEIGSTWADVAVRRIDDPTPPDWERAAERAQASVPRPASERDVGEAIAAGHLVLHAVVGR